MTVVKFTSNLKRFFPTLNPIQVNARDLPTLLDRINDQHPGLKDYVVDEQGRLRKHVNVFIGNDLIKDREQLSDKIQEYDEVYIMQALSGG